MISEKAVKQLVLCLIVILALTLFTGYRLGKLDSSTHQNKVTMDKKLNVNKAPKWEKAPSWAKFRAFDSISGWWLFENEPTFDGYEWTPTGGKFAEAKQLILQEIICEPRPGGQNPEQ